MKTMARVISKALESVGLEVHSVGAKVHSGGDFEHTVYEITATEAGKEARIKLPTFDRNDLAKALPL